MPHLLCSTIYAADTSENISREQLVYGLGLMSAPCVWWYIAPKTDNKQCHQDVPMYILAVYGQQWAQSSRILISSLCSCWSLTSFQLGYRKCLTWLRQVYWTSARFINMNNALNIRKQDHACRGRTGFWKVEPGVSVFPGTFIVTESSRCRRTWYPR